MIVYHDNGGTPLLRDFFIASGADFTTLYRNYPMRLLYRKLRTHAPKKMIFEVPAPQPKDDKIIVFDTLVTPPYLYWLCERCHDKRIIFWYWNPVGQDRKFELFPHRVELWSYSPEDCRKYGFFYNTPFYFDCIAQTAGRYENKPDRCEPAVFFLGREKGRRQELMKLKTRLESAGADVQIHLMQDRTKGSKRCEPVVPYSKVIKGIEQCDIILDYTMNPKEGLSLRPMEALFFGKKLITNNETIMEYDFYREENIYVLDKDRRSLKEFFKTDFKEPDRDVKDRYLFTHWLERFDNPEKDMR